MKILAVDTATEACSVALLVEGKTFGKFELCPQQHSQKVLPMIDDLLQEQGVKLKDLDALAYGCGPGSFTGVRIATGIVQGLAFGAKLPVVEISTLAAMAQETYEKNGDSSIRVLIDARMQEVYFGDYEIIDGLAHKRQEECVLPPKEALAKYEQIVDDGKRWAIAGTGWQAYADELNNSNEPYVKYPNAHAMLKLAEQAVSEGKVVRAEQISPTYLRDKVTWKKLPHKE